MTPTPAPSLLERDVELRALADAVSTARAGSGAVVFVEGPAGIGKSGLLEAASRRAADAGFDVLDARGSWLEREFSFGLVLQLLARHVTDDDFRGAAEHARPLFAAVDEPIGRPAGDAMFALLHGLHWLLADRTESGPLLLCVDDVHWADRPSLAFLDYLAPRLDGLPLLVVVAYRTGERSVDEELVDDLRERSRVLRPAALSPAATAACVRVTLPAAADEFCAACAGATGGNPFYLRELLAAAIATEIAPAPAGAGRIAELTPESVSRSVLMRLARLPEPARTVAEALSVLGDDVPLRYVADLVGGELAQCIAVADDLSAAQLVTPRELLSFSHPIVRGAVYADVPPARRAELHLRAAGLLHGEHVAADIVASHLLNARHSGAAWVREVLATAARRAHERGDPRAALRYLRRALEESPGDAERGDLLGRLGLAEAEAGEGTGTETLARAARLIDTAKGRARALFDLALVLTHGGRYPHASAAAERGLAELGEQHDALAAKLKTLAAISRTYVDLTDPERTADHIEASLRPAGLADVPTGRAAIANASIALAFAGAPAVRLRALAAQVLRRSHPDDDPFDMMAFALAAYGALLAGDVEAAERASDAGVEVARRRGSVLELGAAVHVRSLARFQAGRVVEALADAESSVDTGRWGWGATLPMAHAQLAAAHLERGDVDRAEGALELPGGQARWAANISYGVWLIARARVLHARGATDAALEQLRTAGHLGDLVHARHPALLPWRGMASEILASRGQTEEAVRLATRDVEEARRFGAPGPLGAALRSHALAVGDTPGATRLLEDSERVLADSPARLEHAHTLVALGAAIRRGGSPAEARTTLRRGLDAAHRCGATALVDRALQELRVAGARPRRPALTGVASLTAAERRVADLAGRGLSNRDVAQRLFVTRRTVEMHLTAVYAKLGIGSRTELAAVLGPGVAVAVASDEVNARTVGAAG